MNILKRQEPQLKYLTINIFSVKNLKIPCQKAKYNSKISHNIIILKVK
ncbi:MAG: hypothetical protein IKW58_00555 [Alphaproteobacteria bacterium]|nr:hypothetical protein [Alphaproteobacteria bacterium]